MSRSPRLLILAFLASGCAVRIAETNWFHPGGAAMKLDAAAGYSLPNGFTAETVSLRTSDGDTLRGIATDSPSARATVLYLGGDSHLLEKHGEGLARAFAGMSLAVVSFDYRGYGGSEGTPTVDALHRDTAAVFDWVAGRPHRGILVVHGFSLGSFLAGELATKRPVEALVLESTAPSVRRFVRNQIPLFYKPFVRVRLTDTLAAEDQEARLQAYTGPLLLVTGSADRITPPWMSKRLFERSSTRREQKRLFIVEGAGHGEAIEDAKGAEAFREFVADVGS